MSAAEADNWGKVVRTLRTIRRSADELPKDLSLADVELRTKVKDACSDQKLVDEFIQLNGFTRKLNEFRRDVSAIPTKASKYFAFHIFFGQTFSSGLIDGEGFSMPPTDWGDSESADSLSEDGQNGFLQLIRDAEAILDAGALDRGGS